ncbi:type III PLP-dependent enzyme [Reichenbachiella sp.]|uniref:type III PLP-dependent enzyme n=1 Tax=Reichenbachiella sp. TaxID=2184521 RepID=UPI003BB07AC8
MLQYNKKIKTLIDSHPTPTLFLSKEVIKSSYLNLKKALPNVSLYYAVKANSHPSIIETLVELGSNFDVCSNAEIDIVSRLKKPSTQWIHTHPIKVQESISYAYKNGIRTFVVDNLSELNKLTELKSEIRILVRMAVENTNAKIDFSKKFGVIGETEAINLIRQAHDLGFNNLGLSFHCGSQAIEPEGFNLALAATKNIIAVLKISGIQLSTLDIGGGFPNHPSLPDFDIFKYCDQFKSDLEEIHTQGLELIAEPGRFIVANSMILATKVIGKSRRKKKPWYFVDESVYNSFSGQVYDQMQYPLWLEELKVGEVLPSVVAGQTCDSLDIILKEVDLPDLEIGTVLLFKNMGAYTSASACNFNGFPRTQIVAVDQF